MRRRFLAVARLRRRTRFAELLADIDVPRQSPGAPHLPVSICPGESAPRDSSVAPVELFVLNTIAVSKIDLIFSWSPLRVGGLLRLNEIADVFGDRIGRGVERKVAAIHDVHFCVRDVAFV